MWKFKFCLELNELKNRLNYFFFLVIKLIYWFVKECVGLEVYPQLFKIENFIYLFLYGD